MPSLIGHGAQRSAFEAAIAGGALHHAWLLAGPQGIGKARFARHVGVALLGGDPHRHEAMIEAHSHPDLKIVEREIWEPNTKPPRLKPYDQRSDDDKTARSIRIEQVRWLQPVLNKSPSLGAHRIILIDSIDDMEAAAANALLKNLEEPPASTTFLLVSHAPGRLLPTIRSRCRLLRLDLLCDDEVAQVLRNALPEADADEIAALVAVAEGSPGRAIRYAGLDVAALDATLAAIAGDGDPDNARRLKLARTLSGKAAQPRYEAFLDRAPRLIAARARTLAGEPLRAALDAHAAARDLAGAAIGLSLDVPASVIEMAGIVARLHPRGATR